MTISTWWRQRPRWQQVLLVAVPGVGIGVAIGAVVGRRRTRIPDHGYSPYYELPDLLDYDDEVVEDEPADIEYDEFDAPCIGPEDPDDAAALSAPASEFCTLPSELEPRKKTDVEFAVGGDRPKWPIDTNAKRKLQVSYQDVRGKWHGRWGREFGATRKSKKTGAERVHVGVDLFADPGDVIVATEGGQVLAALPFYKGTGALYLLTDGGVIVNYGEIERGSWRDFDVAAGTRVKAGDELGRVGVSDDGSHMLHVETYAPGVTVEQIRRGEMQWWKGDAPPLGILDPTRYLVRAQRVHHEDAAETV